MGKKETAMAMKKQQNYANKVGKVLCIAIKEHVVNLKTTLEQKSEKCERVVVLEKTRRWK